MNYRRVLSFFVLTAVMATVVPAAQRTFVSAGSGNDANPCTRQLPCRNFAAAMVQTDSGGEIIVLDSGGYGVVSIGQSVSLISPPGVYAGITAFSSQNAVVVDADNAVVVLRGLSLNGLGGLQGINFFGQTVSPSNTRLYVENCVISAFVNNGVNFARNGELFVSGLIVRENNFGIQVNGPNFPAIATIDRALMESNNQDGLRVENATVAIRDSVATRNSAGAGFFALASVAGRTAVLSADHCLATQNQHGFIGGGGAGTARLMVSNSVASQNSLYGIWASNNGTVRASNNTVTENDTGLLQSGTGVFRSGGNNTVDGNPTEISGTITPFGPM